MIYSIKKISEICEFQNGYAFKSNLFKDKGEPILRISNIQNNNMSYKRLVYFNLKDYDKDLSKYIVGKGDLVIAMSGATTGKLAINNTDDKFYLNQRVGKFIFDNDATKKYTHYLLGTKIEENLKQSVGSAIPNLSTVQIKDIEIPLPSLSTQKLIVKKLDSAFKNIDESINITKKNIENIEELNKSSLASVYNSKNNLGIINDTLDFLTDYHANGSYKTLKENVELKDNKDYALMVRATDLEKNNFTDGVKYLSEYSYNYLTKSKVFGDEIILPKIGSIGNVYFMPKLDRPVSLGMNIFMLKINENNFSKYIYYYLSSHIGKKMILDNAQGAVTKTITKLSVKNIKIPLPPISKQKEIVLYLDEVFEKNKIIKEGYEKKLKDLEEIKQSILKEAFEGRLVKE